MLVAPKAVPRSWEIACPVLDCDGVMGSPSGYPFWTAEDFTQKCPIAFCLTCNEPAQLIRPPELAPESD
jgi:hypothetical protein